MDRIKEYETHMEMYLSLPKGGVGAEIGVCKGFNATFLWHVLKPSKRGHIYFGVRVICHSATTINSTIISYIHKCVY